MAEADDLDAELLKVVAKNVEPAPTIPPKKRKEVPADVDEDAFEEEFNDGFDEDLLGDEADRK